MERKTDTEGRLAGAIDGLTTEARRLSKRRRTIPEVLEAARAAHRTVIVGILNVTPDSFSDGGMYTAMDVAVEQAAWMVVNGADVIDIGGESTRPGALEVPLEEELRRTIPVIEALVQRCDVPISIDTRKAEVARQACRAGAVMVNDVSAMTHDPDMADVVAEFGATVCLMHMRGTPQTMQQDPRYDDVVREVRDYLAARAEYAMSRGIPRERIIVDPGFGFGKTLAHNLELLRHLRQIAELGFPVLAGTSRKSMLGVLLNGAPPNERLEGTAATVALAIANGASLVRVHDVREMARVARVADAVVRGLPSSI